MTSRGEAAVGFFDDVVPSEGAGERAEYDELRARPFDRGFSGPPREWVLPAALPWAAKLGEGPQACVALERVRCWPGGEPGSHAVSAPRAA